MKRKADLPEDVRGDTATFENFMRKLVQVPHSEIKAALEAEREITRRRPRRVSRVPAVSSKAR